MISSEVIRGTIGAESSVQSPRTAQGRAHQAGAEVQNPESRGGFGVRVRTGEEEKCRIAESRSPPGEGVAEEKCRIQSSESETRLRGLK